MAVKTSISTGFSDEVTKELRTREEFVVNGDHNWLYKKRAWAKLEFNGENTQFDKLRLNSYTLESAGITGGYTGGLIKRSEGRDIPNPILESVSIKNTGRGDIYNSALYEVNFSYKVFSLDDLNTIEGAFMIPMNRIRVYFGWHPFVDSKDKSYFVEGELADFGFSANLDGSFSCTGKLLGGDVGRSGVLINKVESSKSNDSDGVKEEPKGIFETLRGKIDNALNIERDEDGSIEDGNLPNDGNPLRVVGDFAVANIQVDVSWYQNDSVYSSYITLDGLVDYINTSLLPDGDAVGDYIIDATPPNDRLIKSTKPQQLLLRGEQGNYDSDKNNFNKNYPTEISVNKMLISTDLLVEVESGMKEQLLDKSSPGSMTVTNYLNTLFAKIKQLTGNAYDLRVFIPSESDDRNAYIVNNSKDIQLTDNGDFEFKIIAPNSLVKNMSYQSSIDSDMLTIAYAASSGDTPYPGVKKFIEQYVGGELPSDMQKELDDKLEEIKTELPEKWSAFAKSINSTTESDVATLLKSYFNLLEDGRGYSGLVRYGIDLSVTIDGIFGIQIMDTFTVDRLPIQLKKAADIYFVVTEVEHSFSDGNWDTTLKGAMHFNV